jgi:hypothetical protein
MAYNKIFKTILAVIALAAFQGDQVAHAISAHQPADAHTHAAPSHAGLPSFATAHFSRLKFEAFGHPCEDLGHSEADCPLANVVDSFDITNISELSAYSLAQAFETAKNSLIPNEVDINTQIRAPPAYLV